MEHAITLHDAVRLADALKPNSFGMEIKLLWLSELDCKLYNEIFLTHEGNARPDFDGYPPEVAADTPLLVPQPYGSALYPAYLQMRIAAEQEETDSYNINATLYNAEFEQFRAWYHRTHLPLSAGRLRL